MEYWNIFIELNREKGCAGVSLCHGGPRRGLAAMGVSWIAVKYLNVFDKFIK
jgi:hypothetical protein